jgi:hypothetical protein
MAQGIYLYHDSVGDIEDPWGNMQAYLRATVSKDYNSVEAFSSVYLSGPEALANDLPIMHAMTFLIEEASNNCRALLADRRAEQNEGDEPGSYSWATHVIDVFDISLGIDVRTAHDSASTAISLSVPLEMMREKVMRENITKLYRGAIDAMRANRAKRLREKAEEPDHGTLVVTIGETLGEPLTEGEADETREAR